MKDNLKPGKELFNEGEEKYRRCFEDDLTGDFIATPEGMIIECNPSFLKIYGFSSNQEAKNFNISKFNPSDWQELTSGLEKENKIQGHQRWHLKPDNNEIHVVSNVVGIFNDEGELVQVKGYVFDDTERKIAEDSLKQSEKKYRLLFNEDLTGDFIATPDGEILECNPAFAETYGFDDCESALKWNISESNPFDWPFLVTRLKKEHKILGYQSWQRRSDGIRIHVIANLMGIFDGLSELIQVKGYIFDDTERKRTEQELVQNHKQITEILNSIQDGFISLNHYWQIIYINNAAADYFNLEPDDLLGQNMWERFPQLICTDFEKNFKKVMDQEKKYSFKAKGFPDDGFEYRFVIYPSPDGISILCIKLIN